MTFDTGEDFWKRAAIRSALLWALGGVVSFAALRTLGLIEALFLSALFLLASPLVGIYWTIVSYLSKAASRRIPYHSFRRSL